MKKILSLVLVLAMVLSSFSFAFAASDDLTGHENEVAVRRLISLGLVKGDTQGYRPDDTITRAEFAAMAVRALGKEKVAEISKGATVFTDVPAAHWASGYIKVASTLGLVNGYGNGQFGPTDQITYEQALAIIVRALGYEQLALDKGGYPIGHLVVADDLDLTDAADGVSGMPATRGLVFQVIDNALTVSMMVQVEYGNEAKYEVEDGKTLLGELGYEKVTGRMTVAVNDDNEMTLTDADNKKHEVIVTDEFDSEANLGLKLTAWVNEDDEVVLYEAKDTPIFDAVKFYKDDNEVKVLDSATKYEIADEATVRIDGEAKKVKDLTDLTTYDYAKVVLNSDDEIAWLDIYNWNTSILVDEIDDTTVIGYSEELDVEDYTILKDGKTINVSDVENGDILFYNEDAEYAEVFNSAISGEIEKVYVGYFKLDDGEDYEIDATSTYLNGTSEEVLDEDAVELMKDEGTVTLYVTRTGVIRFVSGDLGEEETTTVAGFLTENIISVTDARQNIDYLVDIVDENGDAQSYELSESIMLAAVAAKTEENYDTVNGDGAFDALDSAGQKAAKQAFLLLQLPVLSEQVITVDYDEDGDVDAIELPEDMIQFNNGTTDTAVTNEDDMIGLDAKYIKSKKLSADVVVFYVENGVTSSKVKAFTWGEVEDFELVALADVYYHGDYADYLVVIATDSKTETEDVIAVVTDTKQVKGADQWRITALVDGDEKVYYTEEDKWASLPSQFDDADKLAVKLTLDKGTEEIVRVANAVDADDVVVANISLKYNKVSGYKLVSDAVIYDATGSTIKKIALRDLKDNDTIDVVLDEAGTMFAKVIILGAKYDGTTTPVDTTITFAYATASEELTVGKAVYTTVGDNDYLVKISGDAIASAVYTDAVTLTATGANLVFDITDDIPANGIYKLELINTKDLTKVLATKEMYLPKNN